MFENFSIKFYEQVVNNEYRLGKKNDDDIGEATHWAAEKVEMATLVILHLVDAEKTDAVKISEYDENARAGLEKVLDRVGKIVIVYIFAGGEPPKIEAAEYFGQPLYSVFWHLDLDTGNVTAPKGQPKKLFNIREMIAAAYRKSEEGAADSSFEEIEIRAEALRPKKIHRYPLFSLALILVNAAILALMYADGFRMEDISIPLKFGAISVDLILTNNEWHRLFTAMFVHFGFMHLFSNAFGIMIFGTRLEQFLGRRIFLAVYIISGLVGSVFSLVHLRLFHPEIISAGASGAVFGIVGALFAYTKITKRSLDFLNWYFMLIFLGVSITLGFASTGIDNFAHVGGLIGGAVVGGVYALFRKKRGSA